MRKSNILLSLAVAPLAGLAAQPTVAADSRPNIVLFMVDDMGWQDTSLPFWKEKTHLNERYHTPNMERLASEGKMFTQAYARSEEHTSELQSRPHLVCRLLLEKKKETK